MDAGRGCTDEQHLSLADGRYGEEERDEDTVADGAAVPSSADPGSAAPIPAFRLSSASLNSKLRQTALLIAGFHVSFHLFTLNLLKAEKT